MAKPADEESDVEEPRPLSLRQLRAIAMLALGETNMAVAKELGVTHDTVGRWKRNPTYRAKLDEFRTSTLADARQIIAGGAMLSAAGLRDAVVGGTAVLRGEDGKVRELKKLTAKEKVALATGLDAAKELLALAGFGKTARVDIREGSRVPVQADESLGRTETELLTFAQTGKWPEDLSPSEQQELGLHASDAARRQA